MPRASRATFDRNHNLVYNIAQFWKQNLGKDFFMPKIVVHPDTGEIISDMINGLPPRKTC